MSILDPKPPTRAELTATYVPKWKANTAYLAGEKVLSPNGDFVSSIADHTSGSSFNAANWNLSANVAAKANAADVVPKWKANTVYAAGDRVVSPAGDMVTAIAAFTSGATYDSTKWYGPRSVKVNPARARGAVVVFCDDGNNAFYNNWLPIAESFGHKLNFPIFSDWHVSPGNEYTGHMSWAQLRDLVNRGHEIQNHSKTHTDMTTQTAAQRVAEWDDSQTAFVSYGISSTAITSFVYPYSKHNLTIDSEGYTRFNHLFTGDAAPYITQRTARDRPFVIGRQTWASGDYHIRALASLRRAAAEDVVVTYVAHNNGNASQSPTDAQFTEFCQLASDLGVPLLTASEAFPAYNPVTDPSFEDTTLKNWVLTQDNATIASVADTPVVGLSGTRSLKFSSSTGTGYPNVLSSQPIPITDGEPRTLSVKVRQEKTSGSYGGYIFIREYDLYGNSLGDVNSGYVNAAGSTAWTTLTLAYTPNAATRSVKIGLAQRQTVGDTFYDHVHFDRTRFGVLG